MMKSFKLLLLALCCSRGMAQTIDWAATIEGVSTEISFSSIWQGSVVMAIEGARGNEVRDSRGAEHYLSYQRSMLVCFASNGSFSWAVDFKEDTAHIEGICHNSKGELSVLLKVDLSEWSHWLNEENEELSDDELEEIAVARSGYFILTYSMSGELLGKIHCTDLNAEILEGRDFKASRSGSYIICGEIEKGPVSDAFPERKGGSGGGDFIACIDSNGKSLWVDAISNKKETCCAGSDCRIALDANGNVYLAGTYEGGGTFGGKIKTIAPQTYEEQKKNNDPYETYLVSYSASGKFRWVRTSGNKGHFKSLVAAGNNIYLAYTPRERISFGENIDSLKSTGLLCAFDHKGKLKWQIAGQVASMCADEKGNIVLLSQYYNYDSVSYAHDQKLNRLIHSLFISISPKGKFISMKTSRLSLERDCWISAGPRNEIHVAGHIWCALPLQLNMVDKNLRADVRCYGGVGIAAKINTGD